VVKEWLRRVPTRLRVSWTEKLYPTERWLYLLTFYVVSVLVAGGVLDAEVPVIASGGAISSVLVLSDRPMRRPPRVQRWWDRHAAARSTAVPPANPSSSRESPRA
jgi:hypothetical protein